MKILVYTHNYPPSAGGIATYSHELCCGLQKEGVDVVLLAPGVQEEVPAEGCRLYLMPPQLNHDRIGASGYYASSAYLKRVLKAEKPDLLLCCSVDAIYTSALIRLDQCALVLTVHGTEIIRNFPPRSIASRLRSAILAKALRRAQRVIAVSDYTREVINRLVPLENPEKVVTVLNGADIPHLSLLPEQVDKGGISLLSVGRFVEFKGFHLFPEVLAQLCQHFPEITWTLAGDGPMRLSLEKDIKRLGIEKHVHFLGNLPREQMTEIYQTHDLLIHPATVDKNGGSESFGLVLIEAMLCGCPVVTAANGGIPEIIHHMKNGVLCDMTQPKKSAQIIAELIVDRPRLATIAAQAREDALKKFSRQSMATATLKVLHKAVEVFKK